MPLSIDVLLFSCLYPSSKGPIHGIFFEARLRELLKTRQLEAKVIAPVPWFLLTRELFGEYNFLPIGLGSKSTTA